MGGHSNECLQFTNWTLPMSKSCCLWFLLGPGLDLNTCGIISHHHCGPYMYTCIAVWSHWSSYTDKNVHVFIMHGAHNMLNFSYY